MTSIAALEEYSNHFWSSWKDGYGRKDYNFCLALSEEFINAVKPIYRDRVYGESSEASDGYAFAYVFLMLSKGLEDIVQLASLTKGGIWTHNNLKTQDVWDKLCDAKERLAVFNDHYTNRAIIEVLNKQLDGLEASFYEIFGQGLYMSPVILVKKAVCTICGSNIKACSHIPGNLYNGTWCKENVVDFTLDGADIVQSPHDMRCRIWPWNFTDEMTFTGRLFSLKRLDEFIDT